MTFSAWFADELRVRRVRKKDVAADLKLRPATISGWLRGVVPSGEHLALLRGIWNLSDEETAAMMNSVLASVED